MKRPSREWLRKLSAVLAIEEVAHRLSSSFVRFLQSLAFIGVRALLRDLVSVFGCAARWTTVGEAGFFRPQLELF
jgi:hypothetical protein